MVNIIDSLYLASPEPLDVRTVVNNINDVSQYWYSGMQIYQLSDNKLYTYNASTWIINPTLTDVNASLNSLKLYVDSSIIRIDSSLNLFNTWNLNQDTFITNLKIYTDGSLNLKVNKAGDTMSGMLTINSSLYVIGNVSIGGNVIINGSTFFNNNININKSVRCIPKTILGPITLDDSYYIVFCNSTNNFIVSLPKCSSSNGLTYKIKNINTGSITLDPFGTELIEFNSLYVLNKKGDGVEIISDSSQWLII